LIFTPGTVKKAGKAWNKRYREKSSGTSVTRRCDMRVIHDVSLASTLP
jgi:hypothetical protein